MRKIIAFFERKNNLVDRQLKNRMIQYFGFNGMHHVRTTELTAVGSGYRPTTFMPNTVFTAFVPIGPDDPWQEWVLAINKAYKCPVVLVTSDTETRFEEFKPGVVYVYDTKGRTLTSYDTKRSRIAGIDIDPGKEDYLLKFIVAHIETYFYKEVTDDDF